MKDVRAAPMVVISAGCVLSGLKGGKSVTKIENTSQQRHDSLVELLLWLLCEKFVLCLWFEPEAEWNGDCRQAHDDECNPVEEMWWELLVELSQVDNSAFSRFWAGSILELRVGFNWSVGDLSGCEVEVTVSSRTNNNDMCHICRWWNPMKVLLDEIDEGNH